MDHLSTFETSHEGRRIHHPPAAPRTDLWWAPGSPPRVFAASLPVPPQSFPDAPLQQENANE